MMLTSPTVNGGVLEPGASTLDRFLDVDASALRYLAAVKHFKKIVLWGFAGLMGLALLAWASQAWFALISLIAWIIIAGTYFTPQAQKDVTRTMNTMLARIWYLSEVEKSGYVERMESVTLAKQEVAYQLGRDVF